MTRHDQPYIGQYYDFDGKERERVLTVAEYLVEHEARYGKESEGQEDQAADEDSAEDTTPDPGG